MKKGFTLIELLVVVLIIGILAAVALPQYQLAVDKSKISSNLPKLRALKNAQEVYYLANGSYTDDWSLLDLDGTQGCTIRNDRYGRWYVCGKVKFRTYYNSYVEMQDEGNNASWVYMQYLTYGRRDQWFTNGQASCLAGVSDKHFSKVCKALSDGNCSVQGGWYACNVP
jgi:type II secretion system protein G